MLFHNIWSYNSSIIVFLVLICFVLFNCQPGIIVNTILLCSYPVCFSELSALYKNLKYNDVSNGGSERRAVFKS